MLNYLNQNVYFPKMAPLKWSGREFGVYLCMHGVLEVRKGWYGHKASPHGIIFTNCYVRQCLTSSDSLLNRLVKEKQLVHADILSDMSYVFIGLGMNYCICVYVFIYVFMNALLYTTAYLQVLFSLQHLGRITMNYYCTVIMLN